MTGRLKIAGRAGLVRRVGLAGLVGLVGLVTLTFTLEAQVKDRAEVQLQAAIKQELVEGDLKGAIEQFKKIAQNSSPEVAAQALLHLAACYDTLGQAEARSTYERVVREFPNQKNAVAEARAWIDAHPQDANQQARALRVERVWDGPDIDMEGRPSDDGRIFAFTEWSTGNGRLAIRDLKTGEVRVLMKDAKYDAFAENPVPSTDGKRIAYRYGEDDSSIRIINSDGTNMRVLLRDRHDNYLAAWSPDGRYLAAKHDNGDRTETIVLISTSDGSIRQLKSTGGSLGGFSPDGRFLVYAMNNDPKDGTGGVFTLAVDASAETRLVEGSKQGPTTFGSPIWSPDGGRIIFMSNRSGAPGLWSIRVANGQAGGAAEPVKVNVENMSPRGLTRDGSLYYLTQDISVESYTAQFDPSTMKVSNPVPLTDQAVGNNRGPELSPVGNSVAFIRRRVGRPWAVMVRPSETGEEREVGTINGSGAYGARTLQWFPDGRSLLVIDGVGGQRKRFRQIDVKSGDAKLVFDAPWSVWTGAVSADGKSLFYSIREGKILRLVKRHLDTNAETELYRVESDGTGLFGLVASPDGTSLAFSRNIEGGRALFVFPTAGGAPREIYRVKFDDGNVYDISWTRDSRTLLVVARGAGQGNGQTLFAIPAAGGSLTPLGLSREEIQTPAISLDSRRIVFGDRTNRRELWAVRNILAEPVKAK